MLKLMPTKSMPCSNLLPHRLAGGGEIFRLLDYWQLLPRFFIEAMLCCAARLSATGSLLYRTHYHHLTRAGNHPQWWQAAMMRKRAGKMSYRNIIDSAIVNHASDGLTARSG